MQHDSTSPEKIRVLALFGGASMLGSERGNLEALSAIKENGGKVLLVMWDAPWAEEIRRDVVARGFDIFQSPYLTLRRPDNPINPLLAYPPGIIRASLQLRKAISRFKPTHIHASNQLYVLNFLPALALSKIRIVYRCGDKPILHNIVHRMVWRFLAWKVHKFVAISRFISRQLVLNGVNEERISIIYNRPPARHDAGEIQIEKKKEVVRIIFVGQVNATKGPHLLIDAFRKLSANYPLAELLIAGRISDWAGDQWARDLRESVKNEADIRDRIHFLGHVENIPALLEQCDILVAPTVTEEPLGNVVMEAKQAGVPSIVFPSGGLPEMIEHGVDGYVCEEKSVDSLLMALRFYLDDPEARNRQALAARSSLAKYKVDQFPDLWERIYTCR
ncbi:MAG: glycosyltransferase family 4 protein [Arenimonas sp.]